MTDWYRTRLSDKIKDHRGARRIRVKGEKRNRRWRYADEPTIEYEYYNDEDEHAERDEGRSEISTEITATMSDKLSGFFTSDKSRPPEEIFFNAIAALGIGGMSLGLSTGAKTITTRVTRWLEKVIGL